MLSRSISIPPLTAQFLVLILVLPLGASAASACLKGLDARVWIAPLKPLAGDPLRVMAVATDAALQDIRVTDPAGRETSAPAVRGGGPPWSLRGMVPRLVRGTYRIEARRAGRAVACATVAVGPGSSDRGSGRWDLETRRFMQPGSSTCSMIRRTNP